MTTPKLVSVHVPGEHNWSYDIIEVSQEIAKALNYLIVKSRDIKRVTMSVPCAGADGVPLMGLHKSSMIKTKEVEVTTVLWALLAHLGVEAQVNEADAHHPVVIRKQAKR